MQICPEKNKIKPTNYGLDEPLPLPEVVSLVELPLPDLDLFLFDLFFFPVVELVELWSELEAVEPD
jgi:hypothetical protein